HVLGHDPVLHDDRGLPDLPLRRGDGGRVRARPAGVNQRAPSRSSRQIAGGPSTTRSPASTRRPLSPTTSAPGASASATMWTHGGPAWSRRGGAPSSGSAKIALPAPQSAT